MAVDALWVVETGSEDDPGVQGTGFALAGFGLVTCAHCVTGPPGSATTAFRISDTSKSYSVRVDFIDRVMDVALCGLEALDEGELLSRSIQLSDAHIEPGMRLTMLGFPKYSKTSSHYRAPVFISRTLDYLDVPVFEINSQISAGNSGGPLIDGEGRVVGMAQRGATEGGAGINAALPCHELRSCLEGYLAAREERRE